MIITTPMRFLTRRFQGWGKVVGFEIAELRLFVHENGVTSLQGRDHE